MLACKSPWIPLHQGSSNGNRRLVFKMHNRRIKINWYLILKSWGKNPTNNHVGTLVQRRISRYRVKEKMVKFQCYLCLKYGKR